MKDFAQLLRWRTPGALLLLLAITILTACDGTSAPELIAAYPKHLPYQPVSNAQMELAVADAELAVRQVADSAGRFRGAVNASEAWSNFNGHYARLTVLVPAAEFTAFRRAVARLGRVESERVEEVVGGDPLAYSRVTVTVHDNNPPFPSIVRPSWTPLDIGRAAVSILGRLASAATQALASASIWLVAVAGPFILMVVGAATVLRWLVRRLSEGRTVGKGDRGG